MKWRIAAMWVTALVCTLSLWAQTNAKPKQPAPAPANISQTDRGQQVFEQNCARCHNPPEGFSARISGTIAMHMRVRANLSAADEKALRHFLNP